MRTFVLGVVLLAGCYNPPPPMTAQQAADAQARADYDRQEYARQQVEAADRAKTEQLCAETQDVQVQLKCIEWRLEQRRIDDQRQQRVAAMQERAYRDAQEARDARERRRASRPTCVSNTVGTAVITNCF